MLYSFEAILEYILFVSLVSIMPIWFGSEQSAQIALENRIQHHILLYRVSLNQTLMNNVLILSNVLQTTNPLILWPLSEVLTLHGNKLLCFGPRYFTYSNYLCSEPDIAAVGTTFKVFSVGLKFPTTSGLACYATLARL